MKLSNDKIIYELRECFICDGKGYQWESINCPLDRVKMKGKTCPHCQTKNKYHHYIKTGKIIVCHNCEGNRKVMETKFDSLPQEVSEQIADKLEYKLSNELKDKAEANEGEGGLMLGMFQQLFGATDYINHSKDSLETLKTLVKNSITGSVHQTIHFLNDDDTIKKTCYVTGYNGGYFGKLV